MANTNILAITSPGSRALKNAKYEKYCRLRALAQPRIGAYREVGWQSRTDNAAYINACRLERRPEIRDRIAYLIRQEEDLIEEKRRRIEEQLWAIRGANIQDFFTTEDDLKPTETSSNPAEIANNPDQQKVAVSPRACRSAAANGAGSRNRQADRRCEDRQQRASSSEALQQDVGECGTAQDAQYWRPERARTDRVIAAI